MYRGLIRQRVLLTYRVDEEWLQRQLPPGFVPTIVDGTALAGLCLLRWEALRPAGLPAWAGFPVDGIAERWFAHRAGRAHQPGVVIPRRWVRGRAAATLTRLVAGGHAEPTRVSFLRHGEQLRVRTLEGPLVDVTVAPAPELSSTALFGGDAAAVEALHATAKRGWSGCGNASIAATDMVADAAWDAHPAAAVAVRQDVLPDHAVLDHALVMERVPARLTPVREVTQGPDDRRLAAVQPAPRRVGTSHG